jgi:ankyrin repeat protein
MRNREGHTCFSTAIKAGQAEIIDYLLSEEFPNLDLFCKDTLEGDIPLHLAVRMGNKDLAFKLFKLRPERCLKINFKGQTPIFLAT